MPFSPLVFTKILGTASIGAFTVGVAAGSEVLSQLKWPQQQQGFSTASIGFQRTLHHVRVGLAGLAAIPVVTFTGAMIADWQPYLVYSLGLVGYAGFRVARIILPIIERDQRQEQKQNKVVVIEEEEEEEEKKPAIFKEDISSPGLNESVYNIDKRDYEDTENEPEPKEIATGKVLVTENVVEDYDAIEKSNELEAQEFYKQRLIATLLAGASFLIALVGVAGDAK